MARLSKQDQRIKEKAAWQEFEKIKLIAAEKGVNKFTWGWFTENINKRVDIQQLNSKISPSTMKQPQTTEFILLKEAIDRFNQNFSMTEAMVPDMTKEQLNSSLSANYVLTERIESLTQKLKAKDTQLELADNRINQLLETISQLRHTNREFSWKS